MAHAPSLSNAAATAAIDAVTALLNAGTVNLYTTPIPADANTALTSQTLLATCTFANPAFPAAVAGVATANALVNDTDANAIGTASFFRAFTSGAAVMFQGTCGASSSFDCVLSNVAIVQHGTVSITSCVLTVVTS